MANDTYANSAFGTNRSITITAAGDSGSTTSSGGGGGGGGSGTAAIVESAPIGSQSSGNIVVASFSKTDSLYVDTIQFKAVNEIGNGFMQVTKLDARPAAVLADAGEKLFTYLDIKTVNFKSSDITAVEIQFVVDKKWLGTNKASPSDVLLRKYLLTEWIDLPTRKIGESPTQYIYKAETPGFSYFAITLLSKPAVQNITPSNENISILSATPRFFI